MINKLKQGLNFYLTHLSWVDFAAYIWMFFDLFGARFALRLCRVKVLFCGLCADDRHYRGTWMRGVFYA